MSLASEFHEWVNDQSYIPGVINFNIARPDAADPWFVMAVTSSEYESFTLCSDGGVMTIEISGYGSGRYNTYEVMEQLRADIERNLRRSLQTYSVWMVNTTGTVSTGSVEEQLNEYSFEIIISWEKDKG